MSTTFQPSVTIETLGSTRQGKSLVVFAGDSRTQDPTPSTACITALGAAEWEGVIEGVGGSTWATMLTRYSAATRYLCSPAAARRILVVWCGVNDIASGRTLEQMQTDATAYFAAAAADDWSDLVACTDVPATSSNSVWGNFNTWLRANYLSLGATALVDLAANSHFDAIADASNGTYYADGTHLTATGSQLVGTLMAGVIEALDAAGESRVGSMAGQSASKVCILGGKVWADDLATSNQLTVRQQALFYSGSPNALVHSVDGNGLTSHGNNGHVRLGMGNMVCWTDATQGWNGSIDLRLVRESSGVLALRDAGSNYQTMKAGVFVPQNNSGFAGPQLLANGLNLYDYYMAIYVGSSSSILFSSNANGMTPPHVAGIVREGGGLKITDGSSGVGALHGGAATFDGALRISTSAPPANASATGAAGTIAWDGTHLYVCTATNTWKRTLIDTWS